MLRQQFKRLVMQMACQPLLYAPDAPAGRAISWLRLPPGREVPIGRDVFIPWHCVLFLFIIQFFHPPCGRPVVVIACKYTLNTAELTS